MSLFVIVLAAFAVLFFPSASAVAVEPGLTAPEAIKIETTKTEATKVDATKTEAAKNRKAEYAAEDKAKGIKRANAPCIAWSDPDVPTRAVLLCIHGLGLHKDTYEAFGKRMQALHHRVVTRADGLHRDCGAFSSSRRTGAKLRR